MTLPAAILQQILNAQAPKVAGPKRGLDIFEGTDYPTDWTGFVGQAEAKEQLIVQVGSAKARGTRLDHTLFESGIAGVGKTTLATLAAYKAGVGFSQTTGPLSMHEFRDIVMAMNDRDILFIDEIHRLVAGNKNRADWVLPFLTEGKLYTERGAEKMPDITVFGATTDVGKLPVTLTGRFMVQPNIVPYTEAEAAEITGRLADRMKVSVAKKHLPAIARAADHNPRIMRRILSSIRDLSYAYPQSHPNLEKAFSWTKVSADGLSQVARDMLMLLMNARDYTASLDSLRAQLGEPGPIAHHEGALLQRGMVTITGRGRKLTDDGIARAIEEARSRQG